MAEIQASSGLPDTSKETKIDTGYGEVKLIQRSVPADLQDDKGLEMGGMIRVALSVRVDSRPHQSIKKIEFYVYRSG